MLDRVEWDHFTLGESLSSLWASVGKSKAKNQRNRNKGVSVITQWLENKI